MTDKTSNRPPAREVKQPWEMRVTAAAATGLGYGSPSPGGRKTEGDGSPYHPHHDPLPHQRRCLISGFCPKSGVVAPKAIENWEF
ncbi:MAG: hypothetical protein KAT75_00350 [Dehalococcoidia bacterium]|nr:hypothetical protein [Dehalococcoidia bacterium]